MGLGHSPRIVTDGMVLCLDAANPKNFNLTEVEVLVVAGGGGGGGSTAGGGGGGGVIYNRTFAVTPGSALTVTVGSGGQGTVRADQGVATNTSGGNSVFGSLTAIGGGKGYSGSAYNTPGSSAVGGSGGGGGYYSGGFDPKGSGTSSSGTAGQGFAGGDGAAISEWGGGGGGGAGGPGGAQVTNNSLRTGGPGLGFDISGSLQYYGGGGGGGCYFSGFSLGGIGGGGNGGDGQTYVPTAGATNTGGGGGGGGYYQYGPGGAAGGSGIVIVRYQGPQKAIGGTVTSVSGHTIHTFTTVGSTTFTPLVATNNSAILGLSDLSNNGNFGTSVNGPTYSSANGGSIVFDGTDDYIDHPSMSVGNMYTIECFFNSSSVVNYRNVYDMNYTTYAGISGNIGPRFEQFSDGTANWVWSGVTTANDPYQYTVPFPVSANTWYHITFVMNSGTVNTYVNGTPQNSNISSPNGYVTTFGDPNLGRGFVLAGNRYFSGRISNFKIYTKALTAAEVSQNFNALRGRFGI